MRTRALVLVALTSLLGQSSSARAGIGFALDHFNAYSSAGQPSGATVQLVDQFGSGATALGIPQFFLVPANKNDEGIQDPFSHLTCYDIVDPSPNPPPNVLATNQFGQQTLNLGQQRLLCAPTQKFIGPEGGGLLIDHYLCYDAVGPAIDTIVSSVDQFFPRSLQVIDPVLFCNPVDKNAEGIVNPNDHLTCYQAGPPGAPVGQVPMANQFTAAVDQLDVADLALFCVPSQKQPLGPEPVDHFVVYSAFGPEGPIVDIQDQFGAQTTDLGPVSTFLVPADKNGEGIFDPISHLSCHDIVDGDPAPSQVIVNNQFGPQTLDLGLPRQFCAPTEKLITPGLVTIDHFKCYEATGPSVDAQVDWVDQFQSIGVTVRDPFLLCNPADKNGEGIMNPDEHLVCYFTNPPGSPVGQQDVVSQFNPGAPIDILEPFALCVPSSKRLPPGVPALQGWGIASLGALLGLTAATVLAREWRRRRTARD